MLTCLLEDKSDEIIMPRSLMYFTLLRLVPNEYVGRERSCLSIIRKTSPWGLKHSCQCRIVTDRHQIVGLHGLLLCLTVLGVL